MLDARIRLDLISILWTRELFGDSYVWIYYNPDASPQLGWQWLVTREDKFVLPKSRFKDEHEFAQADFNEAFQSRTLPLSTYGRGQGSLVAKSTTLNNIHKMESGTQEKHEM